MEVIDTNGRRIIEGLDLGFGREVTEIRDFGGAPDDEDRVCGEVVVDGDEIYDVFARDDGSCVCFDVVVPEGAVS